MSLSPGVPVRPCLCGRPVEPGQPAAARCVTRRYWVLVLVLVPGHSLPSLRRCLCIGPWDKCVAAYHSGAALSRPVVGPVVIPRDSSICRFVDLTTYGLVDSLLRRVSARSERGADRDCLGVIA